MGEVDELGIRYVKCYMFVRYPLKSYLVNSWSYGSGTSVFQ